jgi:HD-like signal output (HDOD) protein
VLLSNLPTEYVEVLRRSRVEGLSLDEVEKAVFGATHAEVGGYLLGLWGLPISLVETAVFHHCPGKCKNQAFGPLSIVHVASALTQEKLAPTKDAKSPVLDRDYLTGIGVWDRVSIWRSLAD